MASSPTEIGPVLDAIGRNAARLCEANNAVIFGLEGKLLHQVAAYGHIPTTSHPHEGLPVNRDTVTGRAVLERRTIHVRDLAAEDTEYPEGSKHAKLDGHRTTLATPMLRKDVPIGAILIRRTEVRPFSEKQIELLTTFADQAAIAIENVRLFNAEQQRARELSEALEQQTATSRVLSVISNSPGDLKPIFQSLLENAIHICGAKFGNLWLRDGDLFRAVAVHGAPAAYREMLLRAAIRPGPNTGLGMLLKTKRFVQIDDITKGKAYLERDPLRVATVELGGGRTLAEVPLLKEDELIGSINIYHQVVKPFTEKQIELLTNFAAQAVIAIENTRLLNELRESLQQQTATADVLKIVSRSAFDLKAVLDTLVKSAARLCNAFDAVILLRQDDSLTFGAHYGPIPMDFVKWPITRAWTAGRSVVDRAAIHVHDLSLEGNEFPEGQGMALRLGHRSILSVPLLREGDAIGSLSLRRTEVRPFSSKQIELAETFADQAVIAIENTRLLNELRQRTDDLTESLEQQTATSEILSVISKSPGDLDPVFHTILENSSRLCEASIGTLYFREGDGFRAVAMYGATRAFMEASLHTLRHPEPSSGLGRVVQSKRPVQIEDVAADLTHYSEHDRIRAAAVELGGVRTLLCVPMLKYNELIGAIAIYRQEVRQFNDKQIALVQNFAAQAVIAIENARLLNELHQRTYDLTESLEQQTATSEVLGVISSSPGDLQPVFDAILESATKLCGADRGFIFRQDGAVFRVAASYGHSIEFVEKIAKRYPIFQDRSSATGRAVVEHRVVHIHDILKDPEYKWAEDHYGDEEMHRTILAVPMLKEDKIIGVITIRRTRVEPFTDKQIELVQNFAAQAVIAVENARLLHELRESLQQQTATADVLKVISRSTFDLQTVLNTLVESAARLSDADQGTITRQVGKEFYRAATYGFSNEFTQWAKDVPVQFNRSSASGRALVEGRVVHIPDVEDDPDYSFSEALRWDRFRTALGVPMLREGVPIGVMALTRKDVRPFAEKQIELVSTFADQAAIAIENARLFDAEQQRTHELAKSLDDLRTAQDRLVQTQKLASLGQLTAGIAHEIKNPLNFVNNFSGLSVELIDELEETLARVKVDETTRNEIAELAQTLRGNLDRIAQHGKRADSIVKNMLLHSREGSVEHRAVDINTIVEESLNLAYHGARAEKQGFNIRLERSFDPEAGQAELYPQEISRALLNFISNGFYAATKRSAEAGSNRYEPMLTASTKSLGDRVEIRIRDNGTGIPPGVKEKMFNPFFTTKPAGEGTGLGLSLSHDIIVKQHGGSIEVDSAPGEFTEVRIVLPRTAIVSVKPGG